MNAYLSIAILVIVVVLMFIDKIPMTAVALAGAVVCCALGMHEFSEILVDLGSTTAVLMIGLSVIGAAMFKTGLAKWIADKILKLTSRSEKGVIAGILIVSALLSAISSNTAVVLMMIPLVMGLSREANISLKKTMYPLGLGAGLGGACTLIGTTSNVAGNSVLETAGLTQMGFWDLGVVGIPLAVLGILMMLTFGMKLLPQEEGYHETSYQMPVFQAEPNKKKMIITAVITGLSIIAMMISSSAIFLCSLLGAILLILTGCISEKEAFSSVDFKLIILIAAFGVISSSITASGGGELIANTFVRVVGANASPWLVCAALFLLTCLMTHFLSNVVSVMLMGPIAIHIAEALSVSPMAMVIVVIIAANACFATPLGSPYFTMLMPVAEYRFRDYVRMGLPFVLLNFILAVIIIPLVWAF